MPFSNTSGQPWETEAIPPPFRRLNTEREKEIQKEISQDTGSGCPVCISTSLSSSVQNNVLPPSCLQSNELGDFETPLGGEARQVGEWLERKHPDKRRGNSLTFILTSLSRGRKSLRLVANVLPSQRSNLLPPTS